MWNLIVSVPDHCLSFYFTLLIFSQNNSTEVPISHSKLDLKACLQNEGLSGVSSAVF